MAFLCYLEKKYIRVEGNDKQKQEKNVTSLGRAEYENSLQYFIPGRYTGGNMTACTALRNYWKQRLRYTVGRALF